MVDISAFFGKYFWSSTVYTSVRLLQRTFFTAVTVRFYTSNNSQDAFAYKVEAGTLISAFTKEVDSDNALRAPKSANKVSVKSHDWSAWLTARAWVPSLDCCFA